MSLMRIDDLFHFEKGILQSSKCTEGQFDFITASSEWKTHNEYTHDCEALVFAAAASGSLGRTHYVNGKFISSDLCFIITAKDPIKLPIDLKFYHMIFNEFKNDIVNSTKAGTSKEAIGMKAFGNYKLPYFAINKQIDTKVQFVNMQDSKVELNVELTHQLDLIKQMRQAFLREAMQGRFEFPQQPLTEALEGNGLQTGQQLLTKIKAEKAQLIAEKKLKNEKELAPITEDEIPFEIPEHWSWCRLGDLSKYITSGSRDWSKFYSSDGAYFIRSGEIKSNNLIIEDAIKVNLPTKIEGKRSLVEKGDLLTTITGGNVGKCAFIFDEIPEAYVSQSVALTKLIDIRLGRFIHFCFQSPIGTGEDLKTSVYGIGRPVLSLPQIQNLKVPLPPLHEQEQIVSKLEELMKFCDSLEQSIKESQGYNEMLLQQVLREALQGEAIAV